MRDDFTKSDIDKLAKRVGMRCSNPDCRRPTSGPDANGGTTNIGVAAHITAASPGGPRYCEEFSTAQRRNISNGIWLCQIDAKLIDDDELNFPPSVLHEWKETAERIAALEARGFADKRASPFPDIDRKAPKLIAEMRADFVNSPLVRECILLKKEWSYWAGDTPAFVYYFEDHENLLSVMTIMIHLGAVYSNKYNSVDRYNFTEDFVTYLLGS